MNTAQLQQASRKIEAVGFQVGQRLAQRYTKDRQRLGDTLEIIKFICKDFWMEVYRKQIDKLQTNNRVRGRRNALSRPSLVAHPTAFRRAGLRPAHRRSRARAERAPILPDCCSRLQLVP